jgi:hypothetical protein
LVDAERRAQFEEEGAHFESQYFLTLFFLPPREDAAAPKPGSMKTDPATQLTGGEGIVTSCKKRPFRRWADSLTV